MSKKTVYDIVGLPQKPRIADIPKNVDPNTLPVVYHIGKIQGRNLPKFSSRTRILPPEPYVSTFQPKKTHHKYREQLSKVRKRTRFNRADNSGTRKWVIDDPKSTTGQHEGRLEMAKRHSNYILLEERVCFPSLPLLFSSFLLSPFFSL